MLLRWLEERYLLLVLPGSRQPDGVSSMASDLRVIKPMVQDALNGSIDLINEQAYDAGHEAPC
jgi:hypothetical protein